MARREGVPDELRRRAAAALDEFRAVEELIAREHPDAQRTLVAMRLLRERCESELDVLATAADRRVGKGD